MTSDVTKPTELKFMGRTYKIIFPDKIEDDNLGLTSHSKFLVKVKSKQIPLEEADTLIHEVLHVIWYHMGLCADNSDDVEERFVFSKSNNSVVESEIFFRSPSILFE